MTVVFTAVLPPSRYGRRKLYNWLPPLPSYVLKSLFSFARPDLQHRVNWASERVNNTPQR